MPTYQVPQGSIFLQIKRNLEDRYGSGLTVLKELIQNAEDAEAEVVRFLARRGWPEARNPLLRTPGLLVVNDGQFQERDEEALLSFGASSKGDDAGAIGRFGFGQKAVFHLCDAFVAHAFGHDQITFSEVLNPCRDVIPESQATTWDQIGTDDLALLEAEAKRGMTKGGMTQGFLLWLPLRCDAILPAPQLFFTEERVAPEDVVAEACAQKGDLLLGRH
ncbi:hypothetical protein CKO15_11370 [Halorhodospira abdelmalekii]|uniref:sacsin N-terminal ATP-binding-like domain-containing protein n=1 Tax=Halorhodospira abdelmalekii TaxID=421629 RepID=UPI0019057A4A|nr:hypothetical protein [Halorhodospira abdelmalekii]MBK1735866.1 hypothetical protein [Halorhodospira abdelmalekii]